MQKNIKHREVDLTSKNTDQQTNRILKKIFQNLPKINLKRTLSTAAIIALLTVKIGGGGGVGIDGKIYATEISLGTIGTSFDAKPSNGFNVGAFIDSGNKIYITSDIYSDNTYVPETDSFKFTSLTLNESQAILGGIFTNECALKFDFETNNISVTNTNGSGQMTAGFGYVSDTAFSGELKATDASSVTHSVTASVGAAYGFVFSKDNMTDTADLSNAEIILSNTTINVTINGTGTVGDATGFVVGNVENSTINLSGTTINVTNSNTSGDVYGFLVGNMVNSSITLNNITTKTTAASTTAGISLCSFYADKVDADSSITLGSVTATADNVETASIYAVDLGEISGNVNIGDITAEGVNGKVAGFSAVAIHAGKTVLGNIEVSTTSNNDHLVGVLIGHLTPDPDIAHLAKLAGDLTVGDITVTSNTSGGKGFFIQNSTHDLSATEITGTINIDEINVNTEGGATGFIIDDNKDVDTAIKITGNVIFNEDINVTSNSDNAMGISLGRLNAIGNTSDELGSAGKKSLVVKGDIIVESKSNNRWAVGIHAGQLEELDVEHTISAKGNNAYGIFTRGFTESGSSTREENSVINILDGASIFATGTNATSIRMDSTDKDVVNIETTTSWTNEDEAFTLMGVETLEITKDAVVDLSATASLRGRATSVNTDIDTNISGELKVQDEFFDKETRSPATRKSNLNVTGQLEIIQGTATNDAMFTTAGHLDKLTIGTGATVILGDKAELEFANATDAINITGGTLKVSNTAGIYAADQKTQYVSEDLRTGQLEITVENGKIEVTKDVNSDLTLFAAGLKTTVVEKATIDVAEGIAVSIGDVKVASSDSSADFIKSGKGELILNPKTNMRSSEIDLGTDGTLDIQAGTVNVNSEITGTYAIKANVNVGENTTFTNAGTEEVKINALKGSGTVEVRKAGSSLNVSKGGNFAGKLTGSGNLTLTGETLTLSGNENDLSGTTTLDGGNLTATVAGALSKDSDYVVDDGKLSTGNFAQEIKSLKSTSSTTDGEVSLGTGGLTISTGGTYDGKITGNGGLTLTGGTLELSNTNNNYSGTTTLETGSTLTATADNVLSANSDYVVSGGTLSTGNNAQEIKTLGGTTGTVELGTGNLSIANGGNYGGTVTGTGTLKLTAGILTLSGTTTNATGTFEQNGGIVNLQTQWGGNYTQAKDTTLNPSNTSKIGGTANLSGNVDLEGTYKSLEVGDALNLKSGASLTMDIAANEITAKSITVEDGVKVDFSSIPDGTVEKVVVITGTMDRNQQEHLEKLFKFSNLLVTLNPVFDGNNMNLTSDVESAADFVIANSDKFRRNQIQIAALLDGYAGARSKLSSLKTVEELEGFLTSLLAPELAADALELPLNSPYFRVFNHINNLPFNNLRNTNSQRTNSNALVLGQSACLPVGCTAQGNYEFWFEGYYQGGETHSDSNALSYKTSRGGMMVGVDQYFGDGLLTGLIFGYGNPRVYNSVGKIEADDYTFGAYSRLKVFGIYANAFLGYGSQNYQLRQNLINPNQHTNYNGDSFYASLEFFKPINLRNDLSISPLVAIDFQKAWSDGFKTIGDIPLAVKKGNMDQTVLRIGVNTNNGIWRTRLQYGYQVAGDLYGVSRTSITGVNGNRILSGVNLGRHTLNAGLGADFQLGNRTKLFADYDLDLGKRSTNHTGQFGFVRYF